MDEPRARTPPKAGAPPRSKQSNPTSAVDGSKENQDGLVSALATGGKAERAAAYREIERVLQPPASLTATAAPLPGHRIPAQIMVEIEAQRADLTRGKAGDAKKAELVAMVEQLNRLRQEHKQTSGEEWQRLAICVACVKPLIATVLCADVVEVDVVEWQRAALLLGEIIALDPTEIARAMNRWDDGAKSPLLFTLDRAPTSAFAAVLNKEASQFTSQDSVTFACATQLYLPPFMVGCTHMIEEIEATEAAWFMEGFLVCPFFPHNCDPTDRFLSLARGQLSLAQELGRPERVVAGAWFSLCLLPQGAVGAPIARAIIEAGFIEAAVKTLQSYSVAELLTHVIPSGVTVAIKDVAENAMVSGINVAQPMLDGGLVDILIGMLQSYVTMEQRKDVSRCAVWYGAMFGLEVCLLGAVDPAPIIAKLRAETKETFRFIRDNPIIQVASMGLVSGVQTTKIAAVVWGRDEQGGMDFRQQDLDALIVDIDHFAPTYNPMYSVHGVHILNLCVSDVK